ncbi:inosine/guanosine kinase [Aeromonas schubertii]|uniref:inosine/guanosine kinase n=1 Tax=Aeromonas schubertii TaxID=652 RepID=UPI00067E858F|nr:inosine/guanosine kinase [Aeromonas schubertii]KUE81576.1 inosine/guanosine kinase [Aeromonas schubertii]MBZ6071757.1 inosine/guanosine kinase [Aeromonas schubertii]QCG48546.1 inosine/guanosine kinase [Aeromonas schubertii]
MKFPGQRKSKHYFPVDRRDPLISQNATLGERGKAYVVGIDQTLVDIEAHVDVAFLERYGLSRGHSMLISDEVAEQIYDELKSNNMVVSEFAGGTIGNTMHNYSVLADSHSILLGVMSQDIRIGSYAYRYLCNTSSRVNLDYLQPVDGPIGRCFTFITEGGERSFGINPGKMDHLDVAHIPESIIKEASALVITAYLVRGEDGTPMKEAAMSAVRYAREAGVPVVLTLGTRFVIESDPQWWRDFISENVTVLAMNEEEGEALTGFADPLAAADKALDWADMVLCTAGPVGLYMAAYTEDDFKRETTLPLLPGVIPEFNMYEFSRPMTRSGCRVPKRIYSHISPYMGGPEKIKNTNGAGDGALSAVLHDMVANAYHRGAVPNSAKHVADFLTYSSLSQVCKYANRVSYEVLAQSSPRLSRGLPEKEDSLEEVYWER